MKTKKAYFLLYFLVLYVFAQLCWWGYLLYDVSFELTEVTQVNHIEKVKRMLLGEGGVFFVILILAILYIRSVIKKEVELSLQQQNFLLAVTHELKTPIASSKLNTQLLLKNYSKLSEEQKNKLLSNTNQDMNRLERLVENILIATKLQSNSEIFLDKKELNLFALIEKSLLHIPSYEQEKNRIQLNISKDVIVFFDEDSLVSIVLNLIENALKYSEEIVELSYEKGLFSIRDYGKGIVDKKKVFHQFYREENEETRTSKGSGLGLFLVKKLIEINHATIQIKDNAPRGTVFEICF